MKGSIDEERVCKIQPLGFNCNATFIIDFDSVDIADLKADDVGSWKGTGTRRSYFKMDKYNTPEFVKGMSIDLIPVSLLFVTICSWDLLQVLWMHHRNFELKQTKKIYACVLAFRKLLTMWGLNCVLSFQILMGMQTSMA